MQVTIADTLIALLAGLAIFPAVFAFNIDPTQGPGLVFVTLPNVFNQMPGGYFFAILFFSLLAVAALTSSISILEVVVAYFDEEHGMDRKLSTLIATLAITLFGSFLSLTYAPDALGEVMWHFPNIGDMQIMDWFITLTDQLLPLGGLLISLFIGWGMKWKDVEDECHTGDTSAARYLPAFKFLIRYVAPIMIVLTLLNGLGLLPFIK
jgi:NSS family neurotransmitter:Na+ symporter